MKKAFSKKNLWAATPDILKAFIGRLLSFIPLPYLLGKKFRGTSYTILSSDHWTIEEIDLYHIGKLKEQVETAYSNCKAYRKLYDDAKVSVSCLYKLEDFQKLPLIDKSFINNNCEDLLLFNKNSSSIDYVTTGGTSGIPLKFYINADRSQIEYAYLIDGWKKAGFKVGDTKVVLRGKVTGAKTGVNRSYDPLFNEHYYSSFHMDDDNMLHYVEHLQSLKECFLHVYPSSVYQFARFIKKNNIKINNVKAILAESENVYPEQRKFVESVFNCRYFSSYGHSEKLVAGSECEHTSNYHIWPTYGYLELIDDQGNQITTKGQVGEIVGTGFMNKVMPFIRYKTGDYAEYVGRGCDKCKRNHLIIKNIRGHNIQEHLVANDNSVIPWSAINMHDDTFDDVIKYQFYQDTPGVVTIKIVTNELFNDLKQQRIIYNINKKLKGRIEVSVLIVKEIKLSDRGKSVFVDQQIKKPIGY